MIWNTVLLICGIALVLWGADRFTDAACGLARRWHVSEMVIGLTIVALGTSLPEFTVSFFSILRGSGDMSVGNIIGSNIFNTLVIIGASALMMNIAVDRSFLIRDIPVTLAVSVLFFIFAALDGSITRVEGIALVALFLCYLYYTFYLAKKARQNDESGSEEQMPIWKIMFMLVIGGGTLAFGGNLMVDNGAAIARAWGVSESVIGLTILAAGTSMPELATSLMAARKGSQGLALGNAIGSNVFNIAFVIGLCSSVLPMKVNEISAVDWIAMIGGTILLWLVAFTGRKLCRWEGLVLVSCYVLYLIYILL